MCHSSSLMEQSCTEKHTQVFYCKDVEKSNAWQKPINTYKRHIRSCSNKEVPDSIIRLRTRLLIQSSFFCQSTVVSVPCQSHWEGGLLMSGWIEVYNHLRRCLCKLDRSCFTTTNWNNDVWWEKDFLGVVFHHHLVYYFSLQNYFPKLAMTPPFQLTSLMINFCLTFDLPSAWWLSSAELQQQPCACVCWEQHAASADDVGSVSQTCQDWSQQFTSRVVNISATFQSFCSGSHTVSHF